MADRIKVKTPENAYTHFDTHINNYTLCGLESGGDVGFSLSVGQRVKRKVNCPECVRIVKFCKHFDK